MLNLVLSLSLSHTGHWKFNMAPHGKELSEDLKKIIVALHKDGVGYKKIAKTLKLSCSTVAKTIQRFNRTDSTQNRPHHGRPKKLRAPTNMYCDILKQSMIPSLRRQGRRAVFQHDNDHCLAKEAEGKGDGLANHVSRT